VFDFSRPIDFAEIDRQFRSGLVKRRHSLSGASPLPCPLITSGLPPKVCEELDEMVKPFGLMVVAGAGSGGDGRKNEDVKLVPGACLAIPLVSGDITMSAYGAVTEVREDKVYGFGHSYPLLGYGPLDLPMATGRVHTVISSITMSSKLASVVETVGALTTSEYAAVIGRIGAKARMIPVTIKL
jgi:hypothetical protein